MDEESAAIYRDEVFCRLLDERFPGEGNDEVRQHFLDLWCSTEGDSPKLDELLYGMDDPNPSSRQVRAAVIADFDGWLQSVKEKCGDQFAHKPGWKPAEQPHNQVRHEPDPAAIERAREGRLRRLALKRGYRLRKRRDSADYIKSGTWGICHANQNAWVPGYVSGMSLDEVESFLEDDAKETADAAPVREARP